MQDALSRPSVKDIFGATEDADQAQADSAASASCEIATRRSDSERLRERLAQRKAMLLATPSKVPLSPGASSTAAASSLSPTTTTNGPQSDAASAHKSMAANRIAFFKAMATQCSDSATEQSEGETNGTARAEVQTASAVSSTRPTALDTFGTHDGIADERLGRVCRVHRAVCSSRGRDQDVSSGTAKAFKELLKPSCDDGQTDGTPQPPNSRCSAARSSFSKEKVGRPVTRPAARWSNAPEMVYL